MQRVTAVAMPRCSDAACCRCSDAVQRCSDAACPITIYVCDTADCDLRCSGHAMPMQRSAAIADAAMLRCSDLAMQRCSDLLMQRCSDAAMQRCSDATITRCSVCDALMPIC
jgi:hypothetical protein